MSAGSRRRRPSRVLRALVMATLTASGGVVAQEARPSGFSLDDAAFLSGCWMGTFGELELREQWTAPTGGVMLVTTRFLRHGDVVDWEFGRIVEEDGGVVLWPYPRGTISPRGFALVRAGRELVFENLEHDFPQHLDYRRDGDALTLTTAGGKVVWALEPAT